MTVGLFIPCYINAIYPQVGIASYELLTSLGVDVTYPLNQVCCGQPMANGGFEKDAHALALQIEQMFQTFDYVVGPSASCVSFMKYNYPAIIGAEHACVGNKAYEICEFLHDVLRIDKLNASFPHKVSIHNSCHGVRELKLSAPSELNIPYYSKLRNLLALVDDIQVVEPHRVDECCGFGGLFAVEEEAVSVCMGRDKINDHLSTGAGYITGADSSCLMHLDGIIRREKLPIRTLHIVEILNNRKA